MPSVLATPVGSRRDFDQRLLARIRGEFSEMPGLCLTPRQAARLWNVDLVTCGAALETLVRSGFLARGEDGRFVRRVRTGTRLAGAVTG